ncbi:hypothetical protein VXM50_07405 [Xanthomonas citri pv. citri]|uniref:hypothetical protein n=1 Tax=Xanthomonas citri TaxID=346 RepID=UPI00174D7915|nr:hypothetical protein [Xanthomonas citri]MBD4858771.1 hypothetical protein [Xanthomonas citri pv. citri]QYF33911.1 hypothetical protein HZS91_00551 [Xanthomonas citri pv. citri]
MSNKKANTEKSKPLYPSDTNFPRTHFLYEYEGERAVDPAVLVEHGILLWHEQIYANELYDVSPLWAFAEAELEKRGQAPTHSDLEWLRQQVIINALAPASWNKLEPYPFKGLLISALYLQEARRLCNTGEMGRVWHIIAIAYYNLGLNTVQSASQALALYATKGRSNATERKRSMVLEVLEKLKDDPKINSIADAKRSVIIFIQEFKDENGKLVYLDRLRELAGGNPEEFLTTKAKYDAENLVTTQLERTLNSWASSKGPYPEIAEAFALFGQKKTARVSACIPEPSPPRTTRELFEFETGEYHTRLFNLLVNGETLSVRLGHEQDP